MSRVVHVWRNAEASLAVSMAFEILNVALVLLSGRPGTEGAQVPTFTCTGIDLARIEPVVTGSQLADHVPVLRK